MNTLTTDAPVALVTGGNKDISLETARRLVEAGYRVYLGARNPTWASPPPTASAHTSWRWT